MNTNVDLNENNKSMPSTVLPRYSGVLSRALTVTHLVLLLASPGCCRTGHVFSVFSGSSWTDPYQTPLQSAEQTPGHQTHHPLLHLLWISLPSPPCLSSAVPP